VQEAMRKLIVFVLLALVVGVTPKPFSKPPKPPKPGVQRQNPGQKPLGSTPCDSKYKEALNLKVQYTRECIQSSTGCPQNMRNAVITAELGYEHCFKTELPNYPAPAPAYSTDRFHRIKACRHGHFAYNMFDMYVGRSLEVYGEWSEAEVDFFKQIIPVGATVIDVGANLGAFSVPLAHMTGPTGKLLAFEPDIENHKLLTTNLLLNDLWWATSFRLALGDQDGTTGIKRRTIQQIKMMDNFGGIALGDNPSHGVGPVVQTTMRSIDSIVIQEDLTRVDFIKIDVQGMELAVLKGLTKTLKNFRPAIYLEFEDDAEEMLQLLVHHGYRCYKYETGLFNSENFFNNTENIFQSSSVNCCCFPNQVQISGIPEVTPDNIKTIFLTQMQSATTSRDAPQSSNEL